MSRQLMYLAILTVAIPAAASAQHRGTIELGAFGRWSHYDSTLGLDDAFGPGARLGFFLSGKVLLEADGALVPTKASAADVDHKPFHVRLLGNLPIGKRLAFLIGGGWAYNSFSNGLSETENGVGALLGLRISLGQRLSLRGEAIGDYMLDQASVAADPTLHYGLQAGVSFMLRGGPGDKDKDGVRDDVDRCADTAVGTPVESTGCPDADRDGVNDQGDRCANTPAGSTVDAIGCSDTDRDGVVDPQDRCANTPAGTQVDATGCPPDADRDGVADSADQCANTPAGVRVDVTNGCPVDADGDGVLNAQDTCPNTPAGTAVNASGCPTDSDADGVADATDACAGTPAGTKVDATGCPEAAPIVLTGVTFLSGSAKLTLNSQGPLNRAVQELQQRPDTRWIIEGHTDNVGNREANIRLSKARADAVRAYFVSKGVAANRLTTVGIGPDQPVTTNDSAEGRAQNRRVQLRPQS